MALNLRKYNFSDILKNTVQNYKKAFLSDQVTITINTKKDLVFSFDKQLIKKVIENLLMNAIQYSPHNKNISINVCNTHIANTNIPAIRCSVTDEGIGVPEDELESIFEVFSESSRTASKACGVGLGLSLCKEIVDAHCGEIWGENNSSQTGSTFYFTLPTNLLSLSIGTNSSAQENPMIEESNILTKELSKIYPDYAKRPFALIGISPFNSYFSEDKILEICEWIHNNYDDFAIFIPDQISKYTFAALGYDESRTHRKTKKQDNYTINKTKRAIARFYKQHPEKIGIKIHIISEMKENDDFKSLYKKYSELFIKDKEFRKGCLSTTEWILSNNKDKARNVTEAQKNIAEQYFLYELPVMTNATTILDTEACDFVYHSIPEFLRQLYLNRELIASKQNFLILK
jgi:cyclo(L-tyrosyl-L-tyrosyl) synthase